MVQLLLLKGADKGALDSQEHTPLFLAVENNNVAAALALLAGGANSLIRRGDGPAFHVAARPGHVEILMAAIERGADVNARGPLQHRAAARKNAVRAIGALLEAGANTKARTFHDDTPLHKAASCLSPEAMLTLLRHGANVNAQDDIEWWYTVTRHRTQSRVARSCRDGGSPAEIRGGRKGHQIMLAVWRRTLSGRMSESGTGFTGIWNACVSSWQPLRPTGYGVAEATLCCAVLTPTECSSHVCAAANMW